MTTRGNSALGVQAPMQARSIADLLDAYDRLPPAYRRVAREAAYNIDVAGLETCSVAALRAALAQVVATSVLATYGPDHPQSRRT